jgi:hypothetical protein
LIRHKLMPSTKLHCSLLDPTPSFYISDLPAGLRADRL